MTNQSKKKGDFSSPLFQEKEESVLKQNLTPVLLSSDGVSLYLDQTPLLAEKAYQELDLDFDASTHLVSFAFVFEGKIIGILSWTDYRQNHDMWWTILTTDKHWCTKKVLDYLFQTAKNRFFVERINALTKTDNLKAVCLLKRLGFEQEGRLKRFYPKEKKDAYLWAKFL